MIVGNFSACAPVRLAAGEYTETRGPGVILLEGQTLRLASDHTFAYQHWSDDMSSSRYGTGTYHLAGRTLRLRFGAPLAAAVGVQTQPLAAAPDSLVLAFALMGQTATASQPLPGATILAYGAAGQVVAGATSDAAGRVVLRLPPGTQQVRVQSLGFLAWQQACPVRSTAYQLELPANLGTPYAAGTVKEFRLERGEPSATTLVVRQGGRQTIFQRPLAGQ